jgi:putative solute:sodium symporter small subunit
VTTTEGGSAPRPERVVVTSPRVGRRRPTTIASEIDAQTTVGEVYMRSLMRIQLRLALAVVGLLAVTVGMLPLLFRVSPGVRHAHLLGVPLPWLLLGAGVYPVILVLAVLYVRRAERIEADFSDMVDRRRGNS